MSDRMGRIFITEYNGKVELTATNFLNSLVPALAKFITIDVEDFKEFDPDMDMERYLFTIIKDSSFSLKYFRHHNYETEDFIEPGEKILIIFLKNSAGWWESIELKGLEETSGEENILYMTPSFTIINFPS